MSETDGSPASVPEPQAQGRHAGAVALTKAEPAGSAAKPTVWTTRMLAALERGINGGKYAFFDGYGLISLQATRIAARQSSCR
jgi:hypothetical protein